MNTVTEKQKYLIDAFNALVEKAKRTWTKGNNSGCNKTLQICNELHEEYMNDIERSAKEWFGVTSIDWPGLYPTFEDSKGITHYDIESFIKWRA